ncbi:MAG TPA: FtsX-like permease family protein [Verrucomicrobiae bacterium]|nr:FtsX-like permease family protein [Verrucomicrobiae bacterium]
MKVYDLLELSGRNLREALLRNSLTTLGIGVGVASLVALLSLGIGLQRLLGRQLGRSGLFDSIYVTARSDIRTQRASDPAVTRKPLDDAARKGFAQIPGVAEIYPSLNAMGEFHMEDGKTQDTQFGFLTGLPASARSSEVFDDFQGRFFSSQDGAEAMITADFGRQLLGVPEDPKNPDAKLTATQAGQLVGKPLVLRYAERQAPGPEAVPDGAGAATSFNVVRKEQRLTIVGIVTAEPNRGLRSGGRAAAFLPVAFMESLGMIQPGDLRNVMRSGEGKIYQVLIVRVTKNKDVARIEDQIKKLGFSAFSIADASRNLAVAFTVLDSFLAIFGSLALVVASLGIVNTLVMAILERRREIGIMKAIGASDGDVKMIFFVEAGCMGILGGALGAFLGWAIGRVINAGTNMVLSRQDLPSLDFWYVPWWLVVFAVAFSILVSLVAGLYPASRAAKLDPVQALRHE